MSRSLAPCAVEAWEVRAGRVDPYYVKVLTRVLAAHAMTRKITAEGYRRMRDTIADPQLRALAEQNHADECRHAQMVYWMLEEIGVNARAAERTLLSAYRAPSFEALRFFTERARGEIDLLMAGLSLETTALLILGINYVDSSYAPHARLAHSVLEQKAAQDRAFTTLLMEGAARFGLQAVVKGLFNWLPMAANSFGPPGSGFTNECLRLGLKRQDNQELAELYLAMIARRCERAGLEIPRLSETYPRKVASPQAAPDKKPHG
jgi:1,2-phenylacetyl-CoA epoxidase catalytic subunit